MTPQNCIECGKPLELGANRLCSTCATGIVDLFEEYEQAGVEVNPYGHIDDYPDDDDDYGLGYGEQYSDDDLRYRGLL